MIVSIHQPAYLPWLGYFDRIRQSDVHVVLDHVQFEKGSFVNRNRIKTANGPQWLTIPLQTAGHLVHSLLEMRTDPRQPWQKKHLTSLRQAYARAPGFADKWPKIEALYQALQQPMLVDICLTQLRFWLDELGIRTPIVRASSLELGERKSALVLEICQKLKADHYLSGSLGRQYLDQPSFQAAGVEVRFQDYVDAPYPQLHGHFTPNMGVVDFWMNI